MSNPSSSNPSSNVNLKLLRSMLNVCGDGAKKQAPTTASSSQPPIVTTPTQPTPPADPKPSPAAQTIRSLAVSLEESVPKRIGKRKVPEAPGQFFVGKSGVSMPVPDPNDPLCQKFRDPPRYVPHPHVAYSKKAKAFRFVPPLIYGACLADEAVTDRLSSSDLLDVALQKVGEFSRLAEIVRTRSLEEGAEQVVDKLTAKNKELAKEKEAALRAKDEAKVVREGLERSVKELTAKVHQTQTKVVEREGDVMLIKAKAEALKESLEQARRQAETDAMTCYQTTMALVKKKAQSLYPAAGIDWEALMTLRPDDLDEE